MENITCPHCGGVWEVTMHATVKPIKKPVLPAEELERLARREGADPDRLEERQQTGQGWAEPPEVNETECDNAARS